MFVASHQAHRKKRLRGWPVARRTMPAHHPCGSNTIESKTASFFTATVDVVSIRFETLFIAKELILTILAANLQPRPTTVSDSNHQFSPTLLLYRHFHLRVVRLSK